MKKMFSMSSLLWDPKNQNVQDERKDMNIKKYYLDNFYLASFYAIWNLVQIQSNNYDLNHHNGHQKLVNVNDFYSFSFKSYPQKIPTFKICNQQNM